MDNQVSMAGTLSELNDAKPKKRSKGKDKTKKGDDNVSENFGNATPDQSDLPGTKKRRRNNKEKNNRDDVTEGTIGDAPGEKKKRRRRRDEKKEKGDFIDMENDPNPTT